LEAGGFRFRWCWKHQHRQTQPKPGQHLPHEGGNSSNLPGELRTGDDRNAFGISAGGSRGNSAMERCKSVVRAILTVSIHILAPPTRVFKAPILQVQRKCIASIHVSWSAARALSERFSQQASLFLHRISASSKQYSLQVHRKCINREVNPFLTQLRSTGVDSPSGPIAVCPLRDDGRQASVRG